MTNEFILFDRIEKIKDTINKYGEDNFFVSFSGGKDSTVLSTLIDMALPNNKIPRVFANTGIEYRLIMDFVLEMQKKDERIVVIKPSVPIREMLVNEGYPFKSKDHSSKVRIYQNNGYTSYIKRYINPSDVRKRFGCPKILLYQFQPDFKLKISNKCCNRLKKEPLHLWQKENNKAYGIVGIMRDEGGARLNSHCFAFHTNGKLKNFQPLVAVTKEWEEWFINHYHVEICAIYKEPYNFTRTGCKGCPFNIKIQDELNILEKYFPNERKQCEIIWKPVYDEYRRLNYRLKE